MSIAGVSDILIPRSDIAKSNGPANFHTYHTRTQALRFHEAAFSQDLEWTARCDYVQRATSCDCASVHSVPGCMSPAPLFNLMNLCFFLSGSTVSYFCICQLGWFVNWGTKLEPLDIRWSQITFCTSDFLKNVPWPQEKPVSCLS